MENEQHPQEAIEETYDQEYAEYLSEQEHQYESNVAANYALRGQGNIY